MERPSEINITVHDDSVDSAGKQYTVCLRGGNVSSVPYRVTNRITTAADATAERSLQVKTQPK